MVNSRTGDIPTIDDTDESQGRKWSNICADKRNQATNLNIKKKNLAFDMNCEDLIYLNTQFQ